MQVETVKARCLPGARGLNYPMLEEYDFRGDRATPDLSVSDGTCVCVRTRAVTVCV